MKSINRFIILLLLISLSLGILRPVLASSPSGQTIYIKNPEDLRQLARDCALDLWSQDKTVLLETDLDLEGQDFLPIPTFGGCFDGQGHTIRGINIVVEGSKQGFFRYLQEGGLVKNLKLEAVVTPRGDRGKIGGLVGHNSGKIENCQVSAYIRGNDTVGGLVGWNGTKGRIIDSNFSGTIYGQNKVGGIAGYNAGTILACINDSSVNTTLEEAEFSFQDLSLEDINLERLVSDAMDIGGIAGINTGLVIGSSNKGTIGYPSVGYNVGGIAGRQSGYINECENSGPVYGRKDIGGIVGQMEPHINTLTSSSKLVDLQGEMAKLQSSLNRLLTRSSASSDLINKDVSRIQGDMDDSLALLKSLIKQTEDLINEDIRQINKISIGAINTLNRLDPILESVEDLIFKMGEAISPMKEAMSSLAEAMDLLSQAMEKSQDLAEPMDSLVLEIREAMDRLGEAMTLLRESLELILGLLAEDDQLRTAFSDLLEELGKDLPDMTRVADTLIIISDRLGQLLTSLEDEDLLEKLNMAFDQLIKAGQSLDRALASLGDLGGDLLDISDLLRRASTYMASGLKDMTKALELLEEGVDQLDHVFAELVTLLDYVKENASLELRTTDDQYQKTRDDLFTKIGGMSRSLTGLIDDLTLQGSLLIEDFKALSDQLFRVMDLVFSILTDLSIGEDRIDEIVEDVSSEDIDNTTEGKLSNNKNLGSVNGDINVGGIAGAMSIELELDPEEDLKLEGSLMRKTVFQRRATIVSSNNEGPIRSKKNNVGGIVGNMDLGYIKGCLSTGPVESTAGDYVGGIAGLAHGPIASSYAKCRLAGGNYIGGIAGYAKEIIGSYSLVKLDRAKAYIGAIAGDVDPLSNIKDNYFVSRSLHGIDGISYSKKAEPIEYEALISIGEIPLAFRQFRLNFWADDRLVKTIEFSYGDTISEDQLPKVPQREGYYGKWEELDIKNLIFDSDIMAQYTAYVTVLESREKRDELLPLLLVEGNFTGQDELLVTFSPVSSDEKGLLEQLTLNIPDDGQASHIIRYHPKPTKGRLSIYILSGGVWERVDSKADGKYLVFEAKGRQVTFKLVDEGRPIPFRLISIAILLLILICLVLLIKGLRIKRLEGKHMS